MTAAQIRSRLPVTVTVIVLSVLALAIGLGSGLGLRLKHKRISQPDPGFAPLQPQTDSNYVLNKLTAQPPQTRVFNFTVSQVQGAPDGFSRLMLAVNGIYPGPTIEANQADRLVVHVQNNLPGPTSIHWHGLFQNGTNFYDGTAAITECGIPPGQSLTYNFTFGQFSGTTWWHAHATQYTDGLSGALIVHPTAPSPSGLPAWDEELVIEMADWYHAMSQDLLAQYLSLYGIAGTQGNEPVPDAGTLNGLGQYASGGSYFNFTIQRNKTYRLRLVNTGSFASIRFSVDSHPLTLIEADGTFLAPTIVSGVTITVAQRYSVLLHANASAIENGTYWMRATVQSDMFTYDQPGQNLNIRGIIRYADAPSPNGLPGDPASPDPGPGVNGAIDVNGMTALVPLVPDHAPNMTRSVIVSISFQKLSDGRFLGFLNTTSWEPLLGQTTLLAVRKDPQGYTPVGANIAPVDQLIVTEDSIEVLDIQIDNLDDGDHPFHLHGHRPWVMGTGAGRYIGQSLDNKNPLRRDTVLIPAYSWMVLRFVTDNPGLWAFHCHLAWHMEAGLLMQINSLPSKLAQLDVPQDIISHCAAAAAS